MGLQPYRPARELERELARGDLRMAAAIARDMEREHGRPVRLELALGFLPLIAAQRLEVYDAWACRWLARWLTETPDTSVDRAADIAAALAELPTEPAALEMVRRPSGRG